MITALQNILGKTMPIKPNIKFCATNKLANINSEHVVLQVLSRIAWLALSSFYSSTNT